MTNNGLLWWLSGTEHPANARDASLIPGSGRSPGEDMEPVVAGTQKDCQRGLHYPGLQYELLSKSNYGILSYAE